MNPTRSLMAKLVWRNAALLSLVGAATTAARPCPLPSGGIAWWRAEGDWLDSIGTNHGTPQGAVSYAPGKVGQAFSFNGTDTWLVMPPVLTNARAFSFEGWLKIRRFTNPDYTPILCQPCASQSPACIPGEYWFFAGTETSYGSFRFTAVWHDATQCDVHSVIPFGTGTWEHVAVTCDGEVATIYWNGQVQAQQSSAGKTLGNAPPFWVGRAFVPHTNGRHENAYLEGLVDEFAVYNRTLTAEEVTAIHAAGSSSKTPPQELKILGPTRSRGNLVFTFPTAANQSYTMQFNDELVTANWLDQTNLTTDGTLMAVEVPVSDTPQRFYRVKQP